MASQSEKRRMQDYIASRLEGSGSPVVSIKGTPNCIVVQGKGLVLLIDKAYPGKRFMKIYHDARCLCENFAVVFYKDGETFFRSCVGDERITGIQSKGFKKNEGLSLKNYSNEELRRMISLRPEERYVAKARQGQNGSWLQYYQPKSEKLEEGIESFRFMPVVFDYTHLPENGFAKGQEESKQIYIWGQRVHNSGQLVLKRGLLIG